MQISTVVNWAPCAFARSDMELQPGPKVYSPSKSGYKATLVTYFIHKKNGPQFSCSLLGPIVLKGSRIEGSHKL
jgi:hypothetical protein